MAYNEADENKKKECITLLKEKAKSKGGKLSYGEISEIISIWIRILSTMCTKK